MLDAIMFATTFNLEQYLIRTDKNQCSMFRSAFSANDSSILYHCYSCQNHCTWSPRKAHNNRKKSHIQSIFENKEENLEIFFFFNWRITKGVKSTNPNSASALHITCTRPSSFEHVISLKDSAANLVLQMECLNSHNLWLWQEYFSFEVKLTCLIELRGKGDDNYSYPSWHLQRGGKTKKIK